MGEAYLESRQMSFQAFHSFRGVTFDLRFIIFRRAKRPEFPDDDLGFVHFGRLAGRLNSCRLWCFCEKVKLAPLRNGTKNACVRVFPEEFVRGRADPEIESDSARAYKKNTHPECLP